MPPTDLNESGSGHLRKHEVVAAHQALVARTEVAGLQAPSDVGMPRFAVSIGPRECSGRGWRRGGVVGRVRMGDIRI